MNISTTDKYDKEFKRIDDSMQQQTKDIESLIEALNFRIRQMEENNIHEDDDNTTSQKLTSARHSGNLYNPTYEDNSFFKTDVKGSPLKDLNETNNQIRDHSVSP